MPPHSSPTSKGRWPSPRSADRKIDGDEDSTETGKPHSQPEMGPSDGLGSGSATDPAQYGDADDAEAASEEDGGGNSDQAFEQISHSVRNIEALLGLPTSRPRQAPNSCVYTTPMYELGGPGDRAGDGYGSGDGEGPGREVVELIEAARRLRRRCREGRSGGRLGEELILLRHACDLVELEFAESAAAFAAAEGHGEEGWVSPLQWLRHRCHLSGHAGASALVVGAHAARLPLTVEAVEEGEVGFSHLALMASTARAVEESAGWPGGEAVFDERPLLDKAVTSTVGRFRRECAHARHAVDARAFLAEHIDAVEARTLELHPREDGMMFLKGWLDPPGAATVRTALEPLARRLGPEDRRHRDRRLADALVELAGHGLDEGRLPESGCQRPHLQVTTALDTLEGRAGSPAGELELSTPIPAATVQRLACDATITRVLVDGGAAVVDVGRARQVVPEATRRALTVRDRDCRWPGCERPASWTTAHHLVPWADGGTTDLDNLVLLCTRHHWLVHEGGWQLVRSEDGCLVPEPPRHRRQHGHHPPRPDPTHDIPRQPLQHHPPPGG